MRSPRLPEGTEAESVEADDLAGVMGTPLTRALRLGLIVGAVVLLGVTRGLPMLLVVASVVVMIFLHELGHYVAARRAGMKVTEFFLGFGPRIWSFRRGETEYGLKLVPAGAYVRIVGMNNLDEVPAADEARTYRQAPFRSRLGVGVAGSAMHFAIAIVLLFVQFAFIGWTDGDRWEVDRVSPHSAAAVAGIEPGDVIVSFDGQPAASFAAFRDLLRTADVGRVPVVVERDGRRTTLPVDLSRRVKVVGTVGEDLDVLDAGDGLRVGPVRPDGVLAAAGLREGDVVAELDGVPLRTLADVGPAVERSVGGRLQVRTAGTGGATTLHRVDLGSDVTALGATAFLGVGDRPVLVTRSAPAALGASFAQFGRLVGAGVGGVGHFIWPPNLVRFVSGTLTGAVDKDPTDRPTPAERTPVGANGQRPVSIVGAVMVGSDLTSDNLASLVLFLVQLNVFIGVFNLIPLLPFDGGHVAIACYEKAQELRRRSRARYIADVSRMLPVAYGVVMVLVVVGLMAMYLDVTRGVSL